MKMKRIRVITIAIMMAFLLIQPHVLKAQNEKNLVNTWSFGGDIWGDEIERRKENWVINDQNSIDINLSLDIPEEEYADYTFGSFKCSDSSIIELNKTIYFSNNLDTLIAASGVMKKEGTVYFTIDITKDGVTQTLKSDPVIYRKMQAEITAFTLDDQKQFVKADELKTGETYYISAMIGDIPIHETYGRNYFIETNDHASDKYYTVESDKYLILSSATPKDVTVNFSLYPGLGGTGQLLQKTSKVLSFKDNNPQVEEPSKPQDSNQEKPSVPEKPIQQTIKDIKSSILISGNLVEGSQLMVQNINDNEIIAKAMNEMNKYEAFDLTLVKDNAIIQPNGKVKVSVPIPEGFVRENVTIYYVNDAGDKTELPHTIVDNYAVFETDHFSMYVIAEKAEVKKSQQPKKDTEINTTDNNTNEANSQNTVNTGDNTNMLLYGILLVSAMGILTILKIKKRRESM